MNEHQHLAIEALRRLREPPDTRAFNNSTSPEMRKQLLAIFEQQRRDIDAAIAWISSLPTLQGIQAS